VEFRVLGPVDVIDDGSTVALGGKQQRRLLAVLVANRGRVVRVDRLVEVLWPGEDGPVDAVATVHTYIARLRRALGDRAVVRLGPGYQLDASSDRVDSDDFERLLAAARGESGRVAVAMYERALCIWRGGAYLDFVEEWWARSEVERLEELRLVAAEERLDWLLQLGDHAEAVAELQGLVAGQPLRPRLVGQLMVALDASGREAEAHRVYRAFHAAVRDLGLDPCADLLALDRSIAVRHSQSAPEPPTGNLGTRPSELLRRLDAEMLPQGVPTPSAPGFVLARVRPLPRSSFVGRDNDLQRVADLLAVRRVVSIVGPGGVGKTRLARHAADAVRDRYKDGVMWVELSSLGDAADVSAAIANALRLSVVPGEALLDQVADALAGRRLLVVLDNCEHLADGVAIVAERIADAETVDVLLTSRVPLRVDNEHVVVLAPLAQNDATRLFVDRLAAVAAQDMASPADADVVAEIVGRLDGLPLVLELAAARVPGLGLCGLRDALDEPFGVLSGGHRSGHHGSLLEVVEWSVRLLTDAQRELFIDMATFVGPVEFPAVAAISECGEPVAGALADLVDRSLVIRHDGDPATYGMFEFLRAYGCGHLTSDRRVAKSAERHARWAVQFAEALFAAETTPEQAAARRRFDVHLPDLRAAHAWLCGNGRTDELIRLTIVLAHHACHRLLVDLVGLVDETVRAVAHVNDPLRVRLLGLVANFGWQRGDLGLAERYSQEALDLADSLGVTSSTAAAHGALGTVLMMRGDLDGARTECEQARCLAAADDDLYTETWALLDLGLSATYAGDDDAAARYSDALDALATAVDAPSVRGWAAYLHGERLAERDPTAATRHLTDAVAAAEEIDDRFLAGVARHTLMTTAARMDEAGHAVTSFAGLLDQWNGSGAWTQLWLTMRALIDALSRDGRHREAAVLLGAHATSRSAPAVFGADARRLDAAVAAARRDLGDKFDAVWSEGVALDDQRAITLAIDLTRPGAVRTLHSSGQR
jgi:predicted ATPase/DNA-binding SARP family transcriptional activator